MGIIINKYEIYVKPKEDFEQKHTIMAISRDEAIKRMKNRIIKQIKAMPEEAFMFFTKGEGLVKEAE